MNRTVQFWRLVRSDGEPLHNSFPAASLMTKLTAAKTAGKDLEAVSTDGTVLNLEVQRYPGEQPFLILYRPRRQNQSHLNDRGVMRPLPFEEGQYISEATYVAFLPRNIVGFLLHNDGPRPRRLAEYLKIKFDAGLDLLPIYRSDLDRVLRELSLQSMTIAIPAAQAAHLSPQTHGMFATALAGAGRLLQDGAVELTIKVGRGGTAMQRQQRRTHLLERALNFVGLPNRTGYTKATVVGHLPTRQRVPVDLLEQRFVHKVTVLADELVPGALQIRDDTPIIRAHWEADRAMLEGITPTAGAAINHGLLGEFLERRTEVQADAGDTEA